MGQGSVLGFVRCTHDGDGAVGVDYKLFVCEGDGFARSAFGGLLLRRKRKKQTLVFGDKICRMERMRSKWAVEAGRGSKLLAWRYWEGNLRSGW